MVVKLSNTILETKNLTYTYAKGTTYELTAVDDVNLSIEQGELVGVIGHTGSGKSTLIQHFNAILKPTTGSVYVEGDDIFKDKKSMSKVRFKVGVCFQYPEYQLFEETVYKDIAFGPKNMKLDEKEIDLRVKQCIEYVGLDQSYLEKSPFDLSGGEKRRVAIAGVMAMQPQVLVLDEPCAGLDPKGRETVLSLIKDYQKRTNSTVLVVSHSMEDISKIATKVLVMNKSKLAFYDTVDNVFKHSKELVDMGLNIPQITKLFLILKEKGYDVSTNIYSLDAAKSEILKLMKGRD